MWINIPTQSDLSIFNPCALLTFGGCPLKLYNFRNMEIGIWFILSLAAGAAGTWYARVFAQRHNWLDHPNDRSFHHSPTPRIGGLGLLLPVVLGACAIMLLSGESNLRWWLSPLLPALLVAGLSFADDRIDLSRIIRFGGHSFAALVVLIALFDVWSGEALPLLGKLPFILTGLLLLVWITGLTNSYNFMDGIDGIAAVQGLVAVMGWLSILMGDFSILYSADAQIWILLALAGGLAGFLMLNWSTASIFMGDIGSTFLGFYLAALPLGVTALGLPMERALEAGVFFVWPFVADTGVTFVRRIIKRERIFEAHRSHLYQVLAATFPTREQGHRRTSLLYGLLSLLGIGLYWSGGPLWAKIVVLAWVWIAVSFWTYGIRAAKVHDAEESSSTVKDALGETPLSSKPGKFMPYDIFLSPPEITDAEYEAVRNALDSGFIAPVGPQVQAFEKGLCEYLGFDEIQAVNSGTAAIHLGLRAIGVGPGDCVLCPDLTFIASVNPVRYLGAEPVLVDVDPSNWGMNPQLAREAIQTLRSEGRRVRAMVVVHAFGIPADMDALMQVAQEAEIRVLEDCAGAVGSRYGDKSVGSFGDAAAFSFNGNKVLTTSGGGALYVKDLEMREATRRWANQGKAKHALGYQQDTIGYNYKLSNICAAIGSAQLKTVEGRLSRKATIFRRYASAFADLPGIEMMPCPAHGQSNFWLTSIRVQTQQLAERLVAVLRENGIEASPMWKPMQMQGLNRDLRSFGGEVSRDIYIRSLSLPSGSSLSDADLKRICDIVREELRIAS
jgi:pyridoxal phosphate-dependent aminotransferase EpsN